MCERNQEKLTNLEPLMVELLGLSRPFIYSGILAETSSNASAIHHIHQGEWGGIRDTSKRYLATSGAYKCFIVAIYDKINKIGALSHLDAFSNPELTADLMHDFVVSHREDPDKSRYRIVILGGRPDTSLDMAKFYRKVKEWQRDGLIAEVVVGPVFQGIECSLALDLETGALFNFKPGWIAQSRVEEVYSSILSRAQEMELTGQIPATRSCFPN